MHWSKDPPKAQVLRLGSQSAVPVGGCGAFKRRGLATQGLGLEGAV